LPLSRPTGFAARRLDGQLDAPLGTLDGFWCARALKHRDRIAQPLRYMPAAIFYCRDTALASAE
jgi:hypothetical protein